MHNGKSLPSRLQTSTPEEKKHYFLASGTVFFFPVGKPEDVGSLKLNGVFTTACGRVPVSGIANAQRVLQQQASDRMRKSGMSIEIVDVQLTCISKLGHMLPTEFHDLEAPAVQASPAPTQVQ